MLSVSNLFKKYGDFTALNNVSFTLETGRAAAVLGPNGAGKSTLIKCLLGLLDYSGEIFFDGMNIRSDSALLKSHISS